MKIALVILAALALRTITVLADSVDDAAEALKSSAVYVEPGALIDGDDVANDLKSRLSEDDGIVLAMFPPSEESAASMAVRISKTLGDRQIVGVSSGRDLAGYAPSLPAGLAADLMRRANNVSNDSITALVTFVQNVHSWQQAHPEVAPEPAAGRDDGDGRKVLLVLFFVAIIIAGPTGLWLFTRSRPEYTEDHADWVPDQVRPLLTNVSSRLAYVKDAELRAILMQLCTDIEKFFQLASKNRKEDTEFFHERLTEARGILDTYIQVQDNSRYFRRPEALLEQGKDALMDFGEFVLSRALSSSEEGLGDYRLNTRIMQAHRELIP